MISIWYFLSRDALAQIFLRFANASIDFGVFRTMYNRSSARGVRSARLAFTTDVSRVGFSSAFHSVSRARQPERIWRTPSLLYRQLRPIVPRVPREVISE